MQPAEEDDVQYFTLPASAATAIVRRGAMMSVPWWLPCQRASPQSFENATEPTMGKISFGTGPDGAARHAAGEEADC